MNLNNISHILLIYTCIITIIIYIILYSVCDTKLCYYDDIPINTLKTGDIIFFQLNCIESRIIRFFTKTPYSHAGIICKHNNKIYLCEAYPDIDNLSDYITNTIKDGTRMVLLKDKINYYNKLWYVGNIKCGILPINQEISSDLLIKEMKKLTELNFAGDIRYFINYLKGNNNISYYNHIICFELIIHLYKKLKIIYNNDIIYSPQQIINNKLNYHHNYYNLPLITCKIKSNNHLLMKIFKWIISL